MARRCSIPLILPLIGVTVIVFAVWLPKSGKHKDFAHEMGAIRTLHSINVAQAQYLAMYHRYAATLAELAPVPSGGAATAAAADLIPSDLARGTKSGYNFSMVGSPQGYTVNANPQVYKTTGVRSFFTDQSRAIREHLGKEAASATDPEIK